MQKAETAFEDYIQPAEVTNSPELTAVEPSVKNSLEVPTPEGLTVFESMAGRMTLSTQMSKSGPHRVGTSTENGSDTDDLIIED